MRRIAAVIVLLAVSVAVSQESSARPAPRRAIVDATGALKRLTPQALPVPSDASGRVGPGSLLLIHRPDGDFLCSANFVWSGSGVTYLGAAGHCFLPEGTTATAGPGADYSPSLTRVRVCVETCRFGGQLSTIGGKFADLGPVAYARQTQDGEDVGNDFGLAIIPAALASLVQPSMPVWGGPSGSGEVSRGSLLCMYGNGEGTGEVYASKARMGVGQRTDAGDGSWGAVLPAAPGDSGAAVETCSLDVGGVTGESAAGVLTHLSAGTSATLVVGTTVAKAVAMATQAELTISVVTGA